MRTKGSCRFEPYFKIQRWDARKVAWMDIQKAHPDEQRALQSAPAGARVRLVTVTEKGRTFGEPFQTP